MYREVFFFLLLKTEDQNLWDACCSGDLDTFKHLVDKVDCDRRNPRHVRIQSNVEKYYVMIKL